MSVTEMHDCTHGPKKDCHACLVGELVKVLSGLTYRRPDGTRHLQTCEEWYRSCSYSCEKALAVLEKAKLIEDCIPFEEAEEASRT